MKWAISGLIVLSLIGLCVISPGASANWNDAIHYIQYSPEVLRSGSSTTLNITFSGNSDQPIAIDEVKVIIYFSASDSKSWTLFSEQTVLQVGGTLYFTGTIDAPADAQGSKVMDIVVTAHTASSPIPSTHAWHAGIGFEGLTPSTNILIILALLVVVIGAIILWSGRLKRSS